jgi:phage/plasmid-associated DNA primase
MFKDRYVCSSIITKQWYVYKNHKWEIDRGNTLRLAISRDMYALYNNKINECVEKALVCDNLEEREMFKKQVGVLSGISSKLKNTSDKNNIMKEAMELFYDGSFMKKLDSNKNLLGFDNGVIDFKTKTFRNGEPDDYI